jgi:hypothetical protein
MSFLHKSLHLRHALGVLTASVLVGNAAFAGEPERGVFVLTSSNDASNNQVIVFRLDAGALSLTTMLPTSAKGGASGNAGILQFQADLGAVANFGSNSVSRIARHEDYFSIAGSIALAPNCVQPDSLALSDDQLLVVGANCAESHAWPAGGASGAAVALGDNSAGQIVAGRTWAAVTMKSGSVLKLPLSAGGALTGSAAVVTLPGNANNTPLGAAFWGDILGFTPAHSPDSFALVDAARTVFPITGPTPAYPTNAPCWVAKGAGNIWYTANSPGHAISIFLTDGEGGVFYKSLPLPGAPTDITVSRDHKWLAVIYSSGGSGYIAVYAIDGYGDLTAAATSSPVGVAGFSGVAISE